MDRRTFLKKSSKVVTGAGLAGAVGFNDQAASSKNDAPNSVSAGGGKYAFPDDAPNTGCDERGL